MRHSGLSFVLLAATFAGLAGCVSGSEDQTHGPAFDPMATDTGVDKGMPASPEAGPSTSVVDAGTTPDATMPLDPDASPADDDAAIAVEAASPQDAGSCTSQVAVVAGNGTSLYQSIYSAGVWDTTMVSTAVQSSPAVVSVGSGFQAVVRTGGDLLKYSTSTGTTWSAPAGIGMNTTTAASPALAAAGADVHLVYLGSNGKFYHGTFTANAWDQASDPVGGAGAAQSFGPSPPGATAIGGFLTIAQSGNDHFIYDQSLSGTGWLPAHQQSTAQVGTTRPSIATLSGGNSDALLVFMHTTDNRVSYVTHTTGGAWSTATTIDPGATSTDPISIAPLAGGRAVIVFRSAADQNSYFSIYDANKTPAWTPPLPLTNVLPTGVPAVAPGVCGDDAIAVYPVATANVQAVRLHGATWSAPEQVSATNNAAVVAIASAP